MFRVLTKHIEPYILLVYVSSESPDAEVWFDDLSLIHTTDYVARAVDYYPFGMEMAKVDEGPGLVYRFGYQGQYAELDTATGFNSFALRQYDARIGRFITVDPYGQFFSPYVGMGNSPVNGVDPSGGVSGCPTCLAEFIKAGGTVLEEVVVTAARYTVAEIVIAGTGQILGNYLVSQQTSYTPAPLKNVGYSPLPEQYKLSNGLNVEGVDPNTNKGSTSETVSGYNSDVWIDAGVAVNAIFANGISIGLSTRPLYWGTNAFATASRVGQRLSQRLSVAGFLVAGYQALENPTGGNILDATFAGIGVIPHPIPMAVGGVYFGTDLLTLGITGKDISRHVDSYYWVHGPGGIGFIPIGKKVK